MSIVILILALSAVKLPENSTVEFGKTTTGLGGSESELFRITQKRESVTIVYDRWGDAFRFYGDTGKIHLTNTIPFDTYQDLWDSLAAYYFFALDAGYSSKMIIAYDAHVHGHITVEYSSDTGVVSKKVSFSGLSYDRPFQRVLDVVAKMGLWATASVDQVRSGNITFALPRWTPRMLKYITESGAAPEMTRAIIALVDSTTTHKGSDWRWAAKGPLLVFAESSVSVLNAALSHRNPQVRVLALNTITDAFGDSAVPLVRKALRNSCSEVRYSAAIFLAQRGSADAMPVLYKSLRDATFTQSASAKVLLAMKTPEALDTLLAWALRAPSQQVSQVPGLGHLADERVSPILRRLFAEGLCRPSDIGKRPSDTIMFDTLATFLADDAGQNHRREDAVNALLRLDKYRDAVPAMHAAFKRWPGDVSIMDGLGALHDSTYFDTFVHYARYGSAWQKNHAACDLAYFNSDLGHELKLRVLSSDSADAYAVISFITQPDPRAYGRLISLLQDDRPGSAMVYWSCKALVALGDRRAIPELEKRLARAEPWQREHDIEPALKALREKVQR